MIIFRTDGNNKIAMGHIQRCLSIADALKENGQESVFVLADKTLEGFIKKRGFQVEVLEQKYDDLEGEIDKFSKIIRNLKPNCIIIDSYYVSPKYLSSIKKICKTIYIDDLMAFDYDTDMLINYNIYADKESYIGLIEAETETVIESENKKEKMPRMLLGLDYVPLRKEFQGLSNFKVSKEARNIFVSTGGSDNIHLALQLAEYIKNENIKYKDYCFHLIIGQMNNDYEKIKKISETISNIVLYHNVNNMREIMLKCDIAVSAAGSTLYELCACGIPTINYVLADNQLVGARTFQNKGLMLSLGDLREQDKLPEILMDRIIMLSLNEKKRKEMSEKMQSIVDGKGSMRIAAEVISLACNE